MKKLLFFGALLICISKAPIDSKTTQIDPSIQYAAIAVEEETDDKTIEDKIEETWNTMLVPLLSGVSLTSIFSLVVSIILSIVNRKANQRSANQIGDVGSNALTVIACANKIVEEIKKQNIYSEQTKAELIKSMQELLLQLKELTNKTEDVIKLKEMIKTLGSIQLKIASTIPNVVVHGLGEDLFKLEGYLNNL